MATKKRPLTELQKRFVLEYLVDLNATGAAKRAGYSPRSAHMAGHDALKNPDIALAIQKAIDARAERTKMTADNALRILWDRATADPRELVEVKVGNCRHCNGDGFMRQRTKAEMVKDLAQWVDDGNDAVAFDEAGGVGFKETNPTHPDCPSCGGEGYPRVVIKESSKLTAAGASLYAGAKMGKYGLEITLHDQSRNLEMIGRHLKLFTDRIEVDVGDELAMKLKEARERIAKQG